MGKETTAVRAVRRAKENATEVKRMQDLGKQLEGQWEDWDNG